MDATRLAHLAGIKTVTESITVAEFEPNSTSVARVEEEAAAVKIPAEVKSELKAAIKKHLDAGNENKAEGREQEAKFHFTTAEFLSELETMMGSGEEVDVKRASVKVHSARNSHVDQVPRVVYDFLVPSMKLGNKSLQEWFDEKHTARSGV